MKVSKNYKAFISRVVRDGKVQKAFKAQIGTPVGACVKAGVRPGMSGKEIHDVAKDCAALHAPSGTKLKL
jgi:hypothetical protein